jgi:membrane associated rhomboid family serine protease
MGIYDREYYRREGPGFLTSIALRGQVCKWLVIANIVVFVLQLITRRRVVDEWGHVLWAYGPVTDALVLNTQQVLQGQVWRLLTYAFLHSPDIWQHIVFNMLFLWWFGADVEDLYGPREFLAFYLGSALAGGLLFQAAQMVQGEPGLCLGASGAVTAVMVLCALHFPNRIILLFFFLPLPIWVFVVFQVAQDAFYFLGGHKTGVAVAVHLGGAAFAFVYYKMQWRLTGLMPSLRTWKVRGARPRLRVYHAAEEETPQPAHVAAPPLATDIDEQLEAKVDAVLEKVARFGQASLSDTERQILLRASEVYKKRMHSPHQ